MKRVVSNYESYDWKSLLLEADYLKKPAIVDYLSDQEVIYPD